MKIVIKGIAIILFIIVSKPYIKAQCVNNSSNIYSFIYNGEKCEVIKENKTWIDAATCAVERGGILIEVNDASEQSAVFSEVSSNAGITLTNTVALDGGGKGEALFRSALRIRHYPIKCVKLIFLFPESP